MQNPPLAATLARAVCALIIGLSTLMSATDARSHEADADEIALGSLIDAELAFARMGGERGIREAFLANFADDGVVFEPAPVRLRETWSARPAPADPHAQKLEWKPAQAGVARSHDFGYTTGPYTLTSTAQRAVSRRGVFFSVWRKDASGRWKVLLDFGISTPNAVDFPALGEAPRPHFSGPARVERERRTLLDRERDKADSEGFTPNAYRLLLATNARLHRNQYAPVVSRGAVAADMARRMSHVTWTPFDAFVAPSADMAVTYGRYRETDHAAATHDGYYAHLWLRDARGRWHLAYDIAVPAG